MTGAPSSPTQPVIGEGATDEQRDALLAIASGQHGGTFFEIIASVLTEVRIDLPDGFAYKQAEIGDTVEWTVEGEAPFSMSHEHTYAQMSEFEWSNAT